VRPRFEAREKLFGWQGRPSGDFEMWCRILARFARVRFFLINELDRFLCLFYKAGGSGNRVGGMELDALHIGFTCGAFDLVVRSSYPRVKPTRGAPLVLNDLVYYDCGILSSMDAVKRRTTEKRTKSEPGPPALSTIHSPTSQWITFTACRRQQC